MPDTNRNYMITCFAMLWRSGLSTVVVFNHDILSLVNFCWDKMYIDWKVCICQTRRLKIYIYVIYFNDLEEGLVCILSPIGVCATTTTTTTTKNKKKKKKKKKNSKEQRSVSSI